MEKKEYTKRTREVCSAMNPPEIRMAEIAFDRYHSRDPFEIIDARNINLKMYTMPEGVLGFYTVLNRKQIIGLNANADRVLIKSGAIHELGHSLNDYHSARSGMSFQDCKFYSLSSAPKEFSANITGADLFIDDEFIFERIHYNAFLKTIDYINKHIDRYRTTSAKVSFEQEEMLDFYQEHEDIPSYESLACELGVVEGLIRFKFRALEMKGYNIPNIPDTQADFLKNWKKNQNW